MISWKDIDKRQTYVDLFMVMWRQGWYSDVQHEYSMDCIPHIFYTKEYKLQNI